ncbi:hypothetical protein BGW42_005280 [Actinomortierella wolfii]|nr:hypothetical protein BGW42_005280 [Actinomortierella wolfii]
MSASASGTSGQVNAKSDGNRAKLTNYFDLSIKAKRRDVKSAPGWKQPFAYTPLIPTSAVSALPTPPNVPASSAAPSKVPLSSTREPVVFKPPINTPAETTSPTTPSTVSASPATTPTVSASPTTTPTVSSSPTTPPTTSAPPTTLPAESASPTATPTVVVGASSSTVSTQATSASAKTDTPATKPKVDPLANELSGQKITSPASTQAPPSTSSTETIAWSGFQLRKESDITRFVEEYEKYHCTNLSDKKKCKSLVAFAAGAEERLVIESLVEKHDSNWPALRDELKSLKPSDFTLSATSAKERIKMLTKNKLRIRDMLSDLSILSTCIKSASMSGHEEYINILIGCLPEEIASSEMEERLHATKTQLEAEWVVLAASVTQNISQMRFPARKFAKPKKKTAPAINKERLPQLFNQPVQSATPSHQYYIPQFRGWIESRRTTLNIELDSTVNLMSVSVFKSIPGLVLSLLDTPLEITGHFGGDHGLSSRSETSNTPVSPSMIAKKQDTDPTQTPSKSTSTYSAPADDPDDSDDSDESEDEGENGQEKANEERQSDEQPPGLQTLRVEGVCKHALIKFGDLEQECHIFVVADHPAIAHTGVLLGMPFLQDVQSKVVNDSAGDYWLMMQQNGASVALRFVHD